MGLKRELRIRDKAAAMPTPEVPPATTAVTDVSSIV